MPGAAWSCPDAGSRKLSADGILPYGAHRVQQMQGIFTERRWVKPYSHMVGSADGHH
jgi:hypothetical protein